MRFAAHRLSRSASTTMRLSGAKPPTFADVGKGILGLNGIEGAALAKADGGGAAVGGLARGRVGADASSGTTTTTTTNSYDYSVDPIAQTIDMAAGAAGAYHGYKRNHGSIGWAIGWAFLGYSFPIITIPVAFAQGFGKPA